jgi:hypothetical protein
VSSPVRFTKHAPILVNTRLPLVLTAAAKASLVLHALQSSRTHAQQSGFHFSWQRTKNQTMPNVNDAGTKLPTFAKESFVSWPTDAISSGHL